LHTSLNSFIDLSFDERVQTGLDATLAQPYQLRMALESAILPFCRWQLGWHARWQAHESTFDAGNNWQNGAKLIWGGEAIAVREDGAPIPSTVINEKFQ
jgi:hypothetical protein